jgi:hypothetical protein
MSASTATSNKLIEENLLPYAYETGVKINMGLETWSSIRRLPTIRGWRICVILEPFRSQSLIRFDFAARCLAWQGFQDVTASSYALGDPSAFCTTQERTKDFGEQRENAKKHVKCHNQNVKRLM